MCEYRVHFRSFFLIFSQTHELVANQGQFLIGNNHHTIHMSYTHFMYYNPCYIHTCTNVLFSLGLVDALLAPDTPSSMSGCSQQQDSESKSKDMKDKKPQPNKAANRTGKKSSISDEQRQVKDKERRSANNQRER